MDNSTMRHKLMMGYQGWFNCAEDLSQARPWHHWFREGRPDPGFLNVDMWPDMREMEKDELFSTNLKMPDNSPVGLYSAATEKTTLRHFKWMADYGLDGVYLQRFTGALTRPAGLAFRNLVTRNVMKGAEAHNRVWANMYDISGHPEATLVETIIKDWKMMVDDLKVTQSPSYLRHQGLPVVSIWGFGFTDRPGRPEQAAQVIDFFRNSPEPRYRACLMGGVPPQWRTLTVHSKTEPQWAGVYRSFDVISPWCVGRFADLEGADHWAREMIGPDLAEAKAAGREFLPVIFPGFSWHNMHRGQTPFNQIPRQGGAFYWRQVYNALAAGCDMVYGAMFDEVDEGTAMYKLAETSGQVPAGEKIVSLDIDGCKLPSDWYLRLASMATRTLKGDLALSRHMPVDPENPKASDRFFTRAAGS
jgi:hypothetical protein